MSEVENPPKTADEDMKPESGPK
jgi:hypothetical protein